MNIPSNIKYLLLLFLALFGLSVGAAYQYFFQSFRIVKSPLIKNENYLRLYLGVKDTFSNPLTTASEYGSVKVRRLVFAPRSIFSRTQDCVASGTGPNALFCFDEKLENGKLTIYIYPNEEEIRLKEKDEERLLNYGLLMILEKYFGLTPENRSLYLDHGEETYIFKW